MKLIGCDNLLETNNIVNLTNLIRESMELAIFKVLGRAWNEVGLYSLKSYVYDVIDTFLCLIQTIYGPILFG